MILNLGDFAAGETVYVPFHTFDSNDPSASVTISGLAVTDIEIYKDGSVTQRSSDSGYSLLDTDGIDFDGLTGLHGFSIDLSDNTDAGFFAAGSTYWVAVSAITVDGATVSFWAAIFTIERTGGAATIITDTEAVLTDTEAATAVLTDTEAILADTEASQTAETAILADTEAAITERATLLTDTEQAVADGLTIITDTEAILSDTEGLSAGSGLTPLATGTAQGGSASTIQLAAAETFGDNILNGNVVKITGGTGAGQSRVITSYTGSTDTATISPNWTTNPSSDSTYEVVDGSVNLAAVNLTAQTAGDIISDTEALLVDTEASQTAEASILADTEGAITERSTILTDTEQAVADGITIIADTEAILTDTGTTLDTVVDSILVDTEAIRTDTETTLLTDTEAILSDTEGLSAGSGLTALASGTAQGGTSTTIQLASGETFADEELTGNIVKITSGTGAGQSRGITAYTGSTDTATVSPVWTTTPDATSVYEVVSGPHLTSVSLATDALDANALATDAVSEIVTAIEASSIVTDTEAILSDTEANAAVLTDTEAILADTEGLSAGSGLTPLATGTAQSGTASTIVLAASATFADDELNGNIIKIHTGTGAGQSRLIVSNTNADDTCNVTPNWTTNPSSDSQYEIVEGAANLVAVSLTAQTAGDIVADTESILPVVADVETVLADTEQTIADGITIIADTEAILPVVADVETVLADTEASQTAETSILADTEAAITERATLLTDTEQAVADTATIITDTEALLVDTEGLNNLSAAQVNAEVVDALATDTYAEPGQGAPAATTTLAAKINYLYKAWRNKSDQDATTFQLYADDGTTVDQKATVSDDGSTASKGEIASGP